VGAIKFLPTGEDVTRADAPDLRQGAEAAARLQQRLPWHEWARLEIMRWYGETRDCRHRDPLTAWAMRPRCPIPEAYGPRVARGKFQRCSPGYLMNDVLPLGSEVHSSAGWEQLDCGNNAFGTQDTSIISCSF
jgi:hypothetical protein